jgi:hypothetical protein
VDKCRLLVAAQLLRTTEDWGAAGILPPYRRKEKERGVRLETNFWKQDSPALKTMFLG